MSEAYMWTCPWCWDFCAASWATDVLAMVVENHIRAHAEELSADIAAHLKGGQS